MADTSLASRLGVRIGQRIAEEVKKPIPSNFGPGTRIAAIRDPEDTTINQMNTPDAARFIRLQTTPFSTFTDDDKEFFRNARMSVIKNRKRRKEIKKGLAIEDAAIQDSAGATRFIIRSLQAGAEEFLNLSPAPSILEAGSVALFGVPQLLAETAALGEGRTPQQIATEAAISLFQTEVPPPDENLAGVVVREPFVALANNGFMNVTFEEAVKASREGLGGVATGGDTPARIIWEENHPVANGLSRFGGILGGFAGGAVGGAAGVKGLRSWSRANALIKGTRIGSKNGSSIKAGFSAMDDILFGGAMEHFKPLVHVGRKLGINARPLAEGGKLARAADIAIRSVKRGVPIALAPAGRQFPLTREGVLETPIGDVDSTALKLAFRPTSLFLKAEDPYVRIGPLMLPRDHIDAWAQDIVFAQGWIATQKLVGRWLGKRRGGAPEQKGGQVRHDVGTALHKEETTLLRLDPLKETQLNQLAEQGNTLDPSGISTRLAVEGVRPDIVVDPNASALASRVDSAAQDAADATIGGGRRSGVDPALLESTDPDIKFRDTFHFEPEKSTLGKQIQSGATDGGTHAPYEDSSAAIDAAIEAVVGGIPAPSRVGTVRKIPSSIKGASPDVLPSEFPVYMKVGSATGKKTAPKGRSRVFVEDPGGDTATFIARKSDVEFTEEGLFADNATLRPLAAGKTEDTIDNLLSTIRGVEGADPIEVRKALDQLIEASDIEKAVQQGARLTLIGEGGKVQHLVNAETGEVLGDTFRTIFGKIRKPKIRSLAIKLRDGTIIEGKPGQIHTDLFSQTFPRRQESSDFLEGVIEARFGQDLSRDIVAEPRRHCGDPQKLLIT